MNRAIRLLAGTALIAAIILFALWISGALSRNRPAPSNLSNDVQSAITNPVQFVKRRITGGVGVLLRMDSATGLPIVNEVLPGSAAQQAGLRAGDVIVKVDGVATSGKLIAQVVDSIRGFTAGEVTVTVQRGASTNLSFIIHRDSWQKLNVPGPP